MSKTVQIRARTDAATKRDAERILERLGLSASAAINMFYRQIVMRQALPFPAEIPNAETREAIEESIAGENVIEATDLPELLSKLLTKQERTFDVAELLATDPDLLEAMRRAAGHAG